MRNRCTYRRVNFIAFTDLLPKIVNMHVYTMFVLKSKASRRAGQKLSCRFGNGNQSWYWFYDITLYILLLVKRNGSFVPVRGKHNTQQQLFECQ